MCSRNRLLRSLGCLLIAVAFTGPAGAADQDPVTADEIIELLPTGIDLLDQREADDYDRLVGMGEAAYPALVGFLEEAEDSIVISRILGVFVESQGDKSIAIEAVKQLLAKEQILDDPRESLRVRIAAVDTLGRIGGSKDSEVLYPLLEDPSERLRANVLRALGKIGDSRSIEIIEQSLERRRVGLTDEEQRNDQSFKETTKAIETIQARLAQASAR